MLKCKGEPNLCLYLVSYNTNFGDFPIRIKSRKGLSAFDKTYCADCDTCWYINWCAWACNKLYPGRHWLIYRGLKSISNRGLHTVIWVNYILPRNFKDIYNTADLKKFKRMNYKSIGIFLSQQGVFLGLKRTIILMSHYGCVKMVHLQSNILPFEAFMIGG